MDTRILFALKQGPRSLDNHIREFLACAHYSDLPDIILIEIFCDGINQPLRSQLRREGPRSSLSCFFGFCFDDCWLTIHCGCRGWECAGLVCSALVGAVVEVSCPVCSALVGVCLVCSALVGVCLVCSALVGVCLVCSALVGAWSARVTPRLRRPARVTPRLRRPARVTPRLRRPARVTPRLRRPARVTPHLRRPARVTPRLRRPARITSRLRRPARITSRLRRPARVTSRLRRPARVTSRLRRPARVTSRLRRPARVTSRHSGLPSVPSRPCCLVRPALVGSCLIGPTWTWPSVPSPASTSAPPPSWILLCVSVWKPLLGGGLCYESGCHSLQLHITHGLHLPSYTAPTHSHPPSHQSLPLWPRLLSGYPLCLPPALTHCSASVYVSALSTLPSIPLFDICLSDPLFPLKKPQVDPFASDQSSQYQNHDTFLGSWLLYCPKYRNETLWNQTAQNSLQKMSGLILEVKNCGLHKKLISHHFIVHLRQ